MSKRLVSAAKIEQRLAAVEGNEWDSESSGEEAVEEDDLMTLPEAKPLGSRRKQAKVDKSTSHGLSSVVYVGHIPHGFYEEQMRGFFSQFGDVSFFLYLHLTVESEFGEILWYNQSFSHSRWSAFACHAQKGQAVQKDTHLWNSRMPKIPK